MFRKTILAATLAIAFSVPAYASMCPSLVTKIDAALGTAQLSDADKAKVMELRDKGDAEHKAGQHAESVATLNEALKMLGM